MSHVGWNDSVAQRWDDLDAPDDARPARATKVDRRGVQAITEDGLLRAKMRRDAERPDGMGSLPATGDWLAITSADGRHQVVGVLERTSVLSRRDPAERVAEQVLAANVTSVFLVLGLDGDINPRRIERGLVLAHEASATPVVVLTKTDLVEPDALSEIIGEVESVAKEVDIVALSSVTGDGVDGLAPHLGPGSSVALLGASGAGKSALVNRLLGAEIQHTGEVRASDGKGRHTTTSRHLLPLPSGGVIVDTPGVRGLGMWEASDGIAATFPDLVTIAGDCRFADCQHDSEPGCAVRAAMASGELDRHRVAAYAKLNAELAETERRTEEQRRRRGEGRRRR